MGMQLLIRQSNMDKPYIALCKPRFFGYASVSILKGRKHLREYYLPHQVGI